MNTDNDPRTAARERFKQLPTSRQKAQLGLLFVALARLMQPPEPPADVAPAAFDAGDGAALANAVDAWLQSEVAP